MPKNQFTSDRQPAANKRSGGRKPSHLKAWIKNDNVSTDDVRSIISKLITRCKNMDDVKDLVKDPKTPPMVLFPLKALLNDYKFGRLKTYEWLIEYAYGKAVQETRNTNINSSEDLKNMTPEERRARIDELMARRAAATAKQEEEDNDD